MSPARLRLISLTGAALILALLVVLSLLSRLDLKRVPAASVQVPAPLAIGTELEVPRPVPAVPLIGANGRSSSLSAWR